MSLRLPLFPLGTVLLPGLVLPLHVFEERYRRLVSELLALPPDERRFGVVAIRSGHEVGAGGARALHEIGCVATVHDVETYDDGRVDLTTTGTTRFRLRSVDDALPYLTGEVELLPELPGEHATAAAAAVPAAFAAYTGALADAGGDRIEVPELPADPLVLGYLIAATLALDLDERQALLAEPDGASRLRTELRLLRRETALLEALSCVPAPGLGAGPASPN
ncbi:MAG: peptidase S16 [Frankiales bacterium]|nr:MAG: peptidase S16 [Frankiales bacterium]